MGIEYTFGEILKKNSTQFHPIVEFDSNLQKASAIDLSENNLRLTEPVFTDLDEASKFIESEKGRLKSDFLYGGYAENRSLYRRSSLFDGEEPRSLHLGVDIWADTGTKVFAPLDGIVHSFRFNEAYGDYGSTVILRHQIDNQGFFSLFGHLTVKSLETLEVGTIIPRGTAFSKFGPPKENGYWPPHLHFQLIMDMGAWWGDYPGVCRLSESASYLNNSPDPSPFLQF